MHTDELKVRMRRRPFQPFRICLTDGTSYEIHHPEMMIVGKRSAAIGVSGDSQASSYDALIEVDLFHIIRAEPLEVPTPPSGPQA